MSTAPAFAATAKAAAAICGTAETSLSAPAQSVDIFSGGASGSLVSCIVINAVTTSLAPVTVAGLVYLFLFDGTTNHLVDQIPITAVTGSATTPPFRIVRSYTDLVVPNGWKLRASQSIAGNANLLKVVALYGDY